MFRRALARSAQAWGMRHGNSACKRRGLQFVCYWRLSFVASPVPGRTVGYLMPSCSR